MFKILEDIVMENKREIAMSMIKDGVLRLEKIATYVGLTLEEVKKLAETEIE